MDKQTTETTSEQATTTQSEASEKMIPESRLNNMIQQITELKKERDSYAKAQAEVESVKKAEQERKALEAQEFDKVLKSRDEEKAAIAAELAELKRSYDIGKVERTLLAAGVNDEIARDGLLTRYEREKPDDVAAWIEATKKAHPSAFAAVPMPTSSGPVGTVSTGKTDSSLQSRLNSTDTKVRMAALTERLKLQAEGNYKE
jgi:hypothetical protein